jgi:hypothetical protein
MDAWIVIVWNVIVGRLLKIPKRQTMHRICTVGSVV